jgi:hypothetical protein
MTTSEPSTLCFVDNRRKQVKITSKLALLCTSMSFCFGVCVTASAQDTGTPGANASAMGASAVKPTKEQRKQARKEARAKKNAELKKLENAGYQPSRANDPNYPQDLQNAEKKAGIGQGANQ